ncbi:MAG: hypothetical protein ABSH37_17570 [Bryobacteraceae bacterium]
MYELDFGIEDNLILLHEGRLKAAHAWPIDSESDSEIGTMISNAGAVFVNHVSSRQYFKGADDRLDALAKADGYQRRMIRTIQDSNGRPQFELFRFERVR